MEVSTCQSPNQRCQIHSFSDTNFAACCQISGCRSRSQSSFASGDIAWIGVPVRA
jgi:hypothetical protein